MARKTLLTLSLLMLVFALCVCAACYGEGEEFMSNGFSCVVLEDGTVRITDFDFSYYDYGDGAVEVYIPDTIDGYAVSEIGDTAFIEGAVTSVVYQGGSLRRIGYGAFSDCVRLESVNIDFSGNAKLTIDTYAFYGCSSLKEFVQYNGVTEYVGNQAFYACGQLTDAVLPGLRGVGDGAFAGCHKLILQGLNSVDDSVNMNKYRDMGVFTTRAGLLIDTSDMRLVGLLPAMSDGSTEIVIPTGIQSIGEYAFVYCDVESVHLTEDIREIRYAAFTQTGISEIQLPASLESIPDNPFFLCDRLTNIAVSDQNKVFASLEGMLVSINDMRVIMYPNGLLTDGEARIPEGVRSIGDFALAFSAVRKVTLPDSLEAIGKSAFYKTEKLTEINIPDSVNEIMDNAFEMSALESVSLPDVEKQGAFIFANCSNLANVVFADDFKTIGEGMFYQCANLTHVDMPEGLESIGIMAFAVTGLRDIVIPSGVKSVGDDAFAVTKIESVHISDAVARGKSVFSYCTRLSDVSFESDVTQIGDDFFFNCTELKSVSLPASLEIIGNQAFKNTGLKQIELTDSLKSVGAGAFENCALTKVFVPDTEYGENVFSNNVNLKTVEFADDLEAIPDGMFMNCSAIKSVDYPKSLKSIGSEAFSYTGISKLQIPDSLEYIGDRAFAGAPITAAAISDIGYGAGVFSNCDKLAKVTLADGIEAIPEGMFEYCAKLADIKFPQSLKSIGDSAFAWSGIKKIVISDAIESVGDNAFSGSAVTSATLANVSYGNDVFYYCEKLAKVAFADDIEEIPSGMFYRCEKLTAVTFPKSLVSIGDSAFAYSGIKKVVIPDGVKSVGESAFSGSAATSATLSNAAYAGNVFHYCEKLNKVVFAEGIEEIPYGMFAGCGKLANVALPKSLKSIGEYAFYDSGLTKLTIPENVLSIGELAFYNTKVLSLAIPNIEYETGVFGSCAKLSKVELAEGIEIIPYGMFSDCAKLAAIELPQSLRKIEQNAFYNTALTKIVIPEGVEEIEYGAFKDCPKLKKVTLPSNLNVDSVKNDAFDPARKIEFISK